MNTDKGHFIVFEGIDGCGKTTQISLLKKHIEDCNLKCYETREPSDGPVGAMLRQCLTGRIDMDESTMAALFAADRLDHINNKTNGLLQKINNGINVISDRYILSTYAYQSVRVPLEWVMNINSLASDTLKPDIHIFIDVSPDVTLSRMAKNRFHKELFENKQRLTEVRNRYLELISQLSTIENIIVIDGNKDINTVSDEIWKIISQIIKPL